MSLSRTLMTDGRNDGQRNELILVGLGNLPGSSRLIRCGLGDLIGFSRSINIHSLRLGCRNSFSAVLERFLQPTRSECIWQWTCDVLLCQFFVCSVFCLWLDIVFDVAYELWLQYKMGRRNRYLDWRDDGQMSPHGYTSFNSYVKNLRLFIFITDRQTDREISPVWAGYPIGSSRLRQATGSYLRWQRGP